MWSTITQQSRIESRFSRGSRIECQLPFERYCITKLGLAEGEETSKSFKVSFISLAKPQTENDSDTKPRKVLSRLKRWANLVNFSSRQRDGADVPSFSKPFYCHCRVLYKVAGLQCNFWVCGRNPAVWPFKWNLSGRTFTWYYLFVCLFLLLLFNF